MATLTADMLGSPSSDLEILVTYNSATLVCSQITITNRSTRTYRVTVTSVTPPFSLSRNVLPQTVGTITPSGNQLVLQATPPGDDGQSGVTWPNGVTVTGGTV